MKGFGNKKKDIRKKNSKEKLIPNREQLITKAFQYHSKGQLKEASDIYKYLIKNGYCDPRVLTNLGTIYQQANDFDNAIILYKESIKKFPINPEAYSNLGSILIKKNEPKLAEQYLKKAIDLKPDYIMAYSNLINVYVNDGKLEKAEIYLRKSIDNNPNDANAHLNLGCVLKEQEKTEEAELYLRKSLKLKPEFDLALINLGATLNELGKKDEAEKLLNRAIEINPNSSMAFNNLGNTLVNQNKPNEAEASYRKAIKLKPDFALAFNNLGSLLSNNGDVNEAEKYTQKAIDFNPNFELAYVNLGSIKLDLDKLEESEKLYLKAIEIKNEYQYAYCNLLRFYEKTNNLKKLKQVLISFEDRKYISNEILMFKARLLYREKDFKNAKNLINKIPLRWVENTDQNTRILFWSFKAFIEEKVKNFDEAHECFKKSQLNLKYDKCDPNIFENYIKNYRKNLDNKEFLKRDDYKYDENIEPVFLIGFPRSGTTLLDTILRSHPHIDVLEEKPILQSIEKIIKTNYKYSLNEIHRLNQEDLKSLRDHYLKSLKNNSNKNKDAKILIDKFPFQTVCLPLIKLLFPNAKIIFTHRNPYDTVLSCFQQAFEPNNAMSNFRSINSSARIYDLTMDMWVSYKNKLGLKHVMSKYETLIEDFDSHISNILDFLNLNWDENIKNYRDTALNRGKINTPSSSQVIQPLYKTSIEKWRNYEKFFEDSNVYLDKWVDYFNY